MRQLIKPLISLLGKWEFTGSFKNNKRKKVEGWESYKLNKDGTSIAEAWEVFTITPGNKEVNKGKMKIKYDPESKKFIGTDNDGSSYEIRVSKTSLLIKNDTYRFTGRFSANGSIIKGKWEEADDNNGWKYWYDKTLHKVEEA